MSAPIRPSILPQCTSCARRFSKLGLQEWRPSTLQQQQVRGKKKLAQADDGLTVMLLKDVPAYGRKGAYVPVSIGQMRNTWYPQRTAEYVPHTLLKQLKASNTPIARDFDFTITPTVDPTIAATASTSYASVKDQVSAELLASARAAQRHVENNRVLPSRATELIDILVPNRLDFKRPAIDPTPPPAPAPEPSAPTTKPSSQYQNPRSAASGAAGDLLAARAQPTPTPPPAPPINAPGTAIYGSVSTSDVAAAIKDLLAANEEASKIIFGDEDVRFLSAKADGSAVVGLEGDRVKVLGDFEIEVRVPGAEKGVRRMVRVLPGQE